MNLLHAHLASIPEKEKHVTIKSQTLTYDGHEFVKERMVVDITQRYKSKMDKYTLRLQAGSKLHTLIKFFRIHENMEIFIGRTLLNIGPDTNPDEAHGSELMTKAILKNFKGLSHVALYPLQLGLGLS